jgi:AcrR family transcriptional regulator
LAWVEGEGRTLAKRELSGANSNKTRLLEMTVESQRRRQIIEAARECITQEGVDKLTLRKVAERAAVSHSTIAYYFNTRQELIDSALLEISEDFMIGLRERQLFYGTKDLVDLIDTFLNAENSSARFVVQMIDAGLHDTELRGTHDEFIGYGRDRIEKSLRVGIEMGELRSDVNPKVAAALLHTVLIFWQAELAAGTGSREVALQVGRLVLTLLDSSNQPTTETRQAMTTAARKAFWKAMGSPIEVLEGSLMEDPNISPEAAQTLAQTFRQLYGLVTRDRASHQDA